MQKCFITFGAVLCVFMSWSSSHASVQANPSRSITATTNFTVIGGAIAPVDDVQWNEFTDSGRWESGVRSFSSPDSEYASYGSSKAEATQTSNISKNGEDLQITAQGTADSSIITGTIDGNLDLTVNAYASAESKLYYSFDVSNSMNYKIKGTLDGA